LADRSGTDIPSAPRGTGRRSVDQSVDQSVSEQLAPHVLN